MLIPIIAAILTLAGAFSLVVSSFVGTGAVGDFFFNAAAICLVAGPVIFFSYVVIGLCMEFIGIDRKPKVATFRRSPLLDSSEAPLINVKFDEWIPEGLRRERRGPLGPIYGRSKFDRF